MQRPSASGHSLRSQRDDVLKIPGPAVRFLPEAKHVREEDKKILEGVKSTEEDEVASQRANPVLTADVGAGQLEIALGVGVSVGIE